MTKTSIIWSDVVAVERSINQSLQKANEAGLTGNPVWTRVAPAIGAYQGYEINTEELTPLLAAHEHELLTDAIDTFNKHHTLMIAIRAYSEKRQAIAARMPTPDQVRGNTLGAALTADDQLRLAPFFIELESLIGEIRQMIPPLAALAERVTTGIGPAMRRYLGDSSFPIFEKDETKL